MPERIINELEALRAGDLPTHGGRTLAYVYDSGLSDVDRLGVEALTMFSSANGLDPTAFPSLLTMEKYLVAFAKDLFHAPDTAVGSVTSGGTESILLAVQSARDAHPEILRPAMVLPTTIHAAFHKAAHYFGVERIMVDVDPSTRKARPEAMREALEANRDRVVLMAASTPSYAHGVIDPIGELGAIALAAGVRFHVDACIGGWVLPFSERALQPWDFAVDGVTSLSADLHKYAYTPKGVSLLLHRTPELRKSQFFASADWPGYTMLNATTQSTKSGGPLAAAYAVVKYLGVEGYTKLTERTFDGVDQLLAGLNQIEHLRLSADPDSTLIAVEADETCDVFTISDLMLDRGWYVQPQMSFGEMPPSIHLTMCAATTDHIDEFLTAFGQATAEAVAAGPITIPDDLAAAAQAIDPTTLNDEAFDGLLALAGLGGEGGEVSAPERMAPVNALLNIAPPALREALLIAFLDRLSR